MTHVSLTLTRGGQSVRQLDYVDPMTLLALLSKRPDGSTFTLDLGDDLTVKAVEDALLPTSSDLMIPQAAALYTRLDGIKMGVRLRNCLQYTGFKIIGQVAWYTEAQLLGMKNFGQKTLPELREVLAANGGFVWGMEKPIGQYVAKEAGITVDQLRKLRAGIDTLSLDAERMKFARVFAMSDLLDPNIERDALKVYKSRDHRELAADAVTTVVSAALRARVELIELGLMVDPEKLERLAPFLVRHFT